MTEQPVVLVNEKDEAIGTMEKMEAHRRGLLHRAFSVFIFDEEGRMLLQQRAAHKYHGGGLWTNACCSHPYPQEAVAAAALRRLKEEMGFTTDLKKLFHFTYHAHVENDLTEHEFDHVFAGIYSGPVYMNKEEAAAYRFMEIKDIKEAIHASPEQFTTWFKIIFPRMQKWWAGEQNKQQRAAQNI